MTDTNSAILGFIPNPFRPAEEATPLTGPPNYTLHRACETLVLSMPILASFFVVFRVLARRRAKQKLCWDDYTIISAAILSVAVAGPSWFHIKIWHVGIHKSQIPEAKLIPSPGQAYTVLLSFLLLYLPILPLAKASMILLSLRAGMPGPMMRISLYLLLLFTLVTGLVPWGFAVIGCPPRPANIWSPGTFGDTGHRCLKRDEYAQMMILYSGIDVLTDILIFPVHLMIIKKVIRPGIQLKLAVISSVIIGVFVVVVAIEKLVAATRYHLLSPQLSDDWTYHTSYCLNHIEANLVIILANIPILHDLFSSTRPHSYLKQMELRRDRSDTVITIPDLNQDEKKKRKLGLNQAAKDKIRTKMLFGRKKQLQILPPIEERPRQFKTHSPYASPRPDGVTMEFWNKKP